MREKEMEFKSIYHSIMEATLEGREEEGGEDGGRERERRIDAAGLLYQESTTHQRERRGRRGSLAPSSSQPFFLYEPLMATRWLERRCEGERLMEG